MKIIISLTIVVLLIRIILKWRLSLFPKSALTDTTFLLGIDGGCWKIIKPLMEQGKLPHLKEMMASGAYGDIIPESPFSPPSWTSISTGVSSEKHGIYHFTMHESGKTERVFTTADMINGSNLWELVESAGERTGVVGWLFTNRYPKEIVSAFEVFVLRCTMDVQWLFSKVYLKFARYLRLPFEKICPVGENANADWEMALTLYLINRDNPKFFALRLYGSDAFQHLYWKYLYPDYYDVPASEVKKYAPMIGNYYQKVDRFLGKILKEDKIDVMIVSDHGFQGYSREETQPFWLLYDFDYNKLMSELGFLHFQDDNKTIDWKKTEIYYCGDPRAFHEFSVNLNEREPEGIVPQSRYEKLKEDLKVILGNIHFKDTKEKLFGTIILHDGTPYGRYQEFEVLNEKFRLWNNDSFDILVEDTFQCRFQDYDLLEREITVNSRTFRFKDFAVPSVWCANHSKRGIFFAKGKHIKPGNIGEISTMDIAPTLLHWMDMSVPDSMEGNVFSKIFVEEFIKDKPVRFSKDKKKERLNKNTLSKKEEELMKEQLKNLGYL